GANQMRIGPIIIRPCSDLRQNLRTDLNDHASGPFDLLFRVQKSRVALQRCQDRLVQSKSRNLTDGPCFAAGPCFASTKTWLTQDDEPCINPQENKKFSHRGLAIR